MRNFLNPGEVVAVQFHHREFTLFFKLIYALCWDLSKTEGRDRCKKSLLSTCIGSIHPAAETTFLQDGEEVQAVEAERETS